MTILLSDPRVGAVPVVDSGEPLVALPADLSPGRCLVRVGVADRLLLAQSLLEGQHPVPAGTRLHVREGHRSPRDQARIIEAYTRQVCASRPGVGPAELARLVSRFVAPMEVAGHVAGSAVDVTLVAADGRELDLGTAIDETPEASGGRCFTASPLVTGQAREHRDVLARVLEDAGFVNYPTEWWHWSWGDRYWALLSGAEHAHHAPVAAPAGRARAERSAA